MNAFVPSHRRLPTVRREAADSCEVLTTCRCYHAHLIEERKSGASSIPPGISSTAP
jgi:hypothetical protein